MIMMVLNKAALFTDIHWGRKNNSEVHNRDCMDFIDWFILEVNKDPDIDHIIFLGDWHEQRSAVNGETLDFSRIGASKLGDIGIPVYFCIGNHDLYYRNSREIYTTKIFKPVKNFIMIDTPTIYPELGEGGSLICPFMFDKEYPTLAEYFNVPIWFGHFEFKGFVVTGDTITLKNGPDAKDYAAPTRIMTGHFHKRQQKRNVNYIGNTFPADFSDANDSKRGMATYEYATNKLAFIDWKDAPKYVKTSLSKIMVDPKIMLENSRVRCLANVDITFEESNELRDKFITRHKLREFTFEELSDTEALKDTEMDLDGLELESTEQIVCELLSRIENKKYDNNLLVECYKEA